MLDPLRLALSLGFSVLIGGLGYWRYSLTLSGWLGAIVVGTAAAGLGGWVWGILVVVFFVTSSALSHWRRAAKEQVAADKFAKTERRDWAQTMANGGAVAGLALLYAFTPQPWIFAAALGVLATVTADTWATEVGTLSTRAPRLITSGRQVSVGTSGGVTALGLLATIAGSLTIGVAAYLAQWLLEGQPALTTILAALLGGTAGSLADSLLGATAQAMRFCPHCEVETERAIHRCGTATEHLRGWAWLDNDWVNLLSSLVGGAVAASIWLLIGQSIA
ncbi:MAG: DUF92 domain-containing protein [Chloroflexi bacterium]|nr:DUF92 domain-containing protein [Chloroflexota bacterium]